MPQNKNTEIKKIKTQKQGKYKEKESKKNINFREGKNQYQRQ